MSSYAPSAVPEFPQGIGVPNFWPITIEQGGSGVDMTTVSAVTLSVLRTADDTRDTWTAEIQPGATALQLVANVNFTGTEITSVGEYLVGLTLTAPGGDVPFPSLKLFVVDPVRFEQ